MSLFGQRDGAELPLLARDTPGWDALIALDKTSLAGARTVSARLRGRDDHTPPERIETQYCLAALPRLLSNLCARPLT